MAVPHLLGLVSFLDVEHLISTFGQIGIILIIFLESCAAFFLPGDSLLFTAGLLAAQDYAGLNIYILAIGTSVAAIAGNQVGYWFGRKAGPALFKRPDSRFLKQEYLEKSHHYFEKYGPKTIVLARFIPVVRTFACVVAGAGRMNYRLFITYNIIGGVAWGAGVTLIGFAFGQALPDDFSVDKYLLPIIAIIVFISITPALVEYYRAKKHPHKAPATDEEVARMADLNEKN